MGKAATKKGRPKRGSLDIGADLSAGDARRSAVFRVFGLQRRAQNASNGWFPLKADITPKMCDALVELHEDAVGTLGRLHPIQRRLIEHAIRRYVRDMRKGRWGEGGASFMWSVEGLLQNGQQRLYAAKRAPHTLTGVCVELDHNPGAILNADQGVIRSQLCGLKCAGLQLEAKSLHVSVAKMMEGISAKQPTGSCKHTILELDERMTLHWRAIDFAIQSAHGRTSAGLTVSANLGAVAKACYHEGDLDRLARFMPLLIGMIEAEDVGDRTVVNYAGHLIRTPRSNSGQDRQVLHLKTQHTIACYMRGELRHTFRPMKHETYPLPADEELAEIFQLSS